MQGYQENQSPSVESERELCIAFVTDIDKLWTYETLGSDPIQVIAGKPEYNVHIFGRLFDSKFLHFELHLANDILLAVKDISNNISI